METNFNCKQKFKTIFIKTPFQFAKVLLILCISVFLTNSILAQPTKPTLTVLNLDVNGNLGMSSEQAGNMLRLEIEKTGLYNVNDRYEVKYLIENNKLNKYDCYSKSCLLEIAKAIYSDKMLTGNIELINESIIITIKMLDVKSGTYELSNTREFLKINAELRTMITITLREMLKLDVNKDLIESLTIKNNYNNAINNPGVRTLKLDGPRMGFTYITGELSSILHRSEFEGGFDAYPLMSQFGYQFEKQYLSDNRIQGLFEFIPMLTGLEQGLFIPSLNILHGVRDNKSGLEFAFGPNFAFIKTAKGYYDSNNNWVVVSDSVANTLTVPVYKRIDSRGKLNLMPGFIWAMGYTLKPGNINIPFNFFMSLSKNTLKYGFSFGFNLRNKSKKYNHYNPYIY